jgi:hypothetical protein
VLSYLIPVKDNHDDFQDRFEGLFGNASDMDKMRDLIQSYNPFLDAEAYYDKIPKDLLQQFRKRAGFSDPNAWGSNNEVEGISRVLKCKIRLFHGAGSNDYDDIPVGSGKDEVPELELFYDIAAARGSRDGNYYSFNLEKNVGDEYKQLLDKVDKLLKGFVEMFVGHFEKKLATYSDEVGIEGKTTNVGKIAENIKKGAEMLGVVCKPVGKIVEHSATYVGGQHHRGKAKKIYSVVGKDRISKADLRKVLVEAACDIFQKFESQFLRITTDEGVVRAFIKLAEDAVDRIMNYIEINAGKIDLEISSSFITKGVILGKSEEGIGAGRTVKDEKSDEEWKTSKLLEETGIMKAEDNMTKYYKKNTGKYGYRLLFGWEKWEELKTKYKESKKTHSQEYKYILQSG